MIQWRFTNLVSALYASLYCLLRLYRQRATQAQYRSLSSTLKTRFQQLAGFEEKSPRAQEKEYQTRAILKRFHSVRGNSAYK